MSMRIGPLSASRLAQTPMASTTALPSPRLKVHLRVSFLASALVGPPAPFGVLASGQLQVSWPHENFVLGLLRIKGKAKH